MSSIGPGRIRFGVVGLGRTWAARFRPAVLRLRDRFAVAAVLDPVAARAEAEARLLRCVACTGLAALVERPDVDAVALLAPQWFGLHPVELASRAGKPVYLGVPLPDDPGELDRLDGLIRAGGVPVFFESPFRHHPATTRLLKLLGSSPGPVRELFGAIEVEGFDRTRPLGLQAQAHAGPLLLDPGQALVDWCRLVFGSEVEQVLGSMPGMGVNDEIWRLVLDFGGGRSATLTLGRAVGTSEEAARASLVEVHAGGGSVAVSWAGEVRHAVGGAEVVERVATGADPGEVFLDQFERVARAVEHSAATWADGVAAARVVAAIRRSADADAWLDPATLAPVAGPTP